MGILDSAEDIERGQGQTSILSMRVYLQPPTSGQKINTYAQRLARLISSSTESVSSRTAISFRITTLCWEQHVLYQFWENL